jgi:hypothetical protein
MFKEEGHYITDIKPRGIPIFFGGSAEKETT